MLIRLGERTHFKISLLPLILIPGATSPLLGPVVHAVSAGYWRILRSCLNAWMAIFWSALAWKYWWIRSVLPAHRRFCWHENYRAKSEILFKSLIKSRVFERKELTFKLITGASIILPDFNVILPLLTGANNPAVIEM